MLNRKKVFAEPRSILGNEKYVGDVILMKTIHIGGPGSKRVKNRGEAEQYKATASHQAIISREQFEAVQKEKARATSANRNYRGFIHKISRNDRASLQRSVLCCKIHDKGESRQ